MPFAGVPQSEAEAMLQFVDVAVDGVQKDARGLFQAAFEKYSILRGSNTKVGFEELISAEMFRFLTERMNGEAKVFYQYPGVESDTIDLFVEHEKGFIYIENKMYYSKAAEDYNKDRRKLIAAAGEPSTICVWTHFQYHANRNNPHVSLFQGYACDLKADNFEIRFKVFGDTTPYLIRLAFWEPYREI